MSCKLLYALNICYIAWNRVSHNALCISMNEIIFIVFLMHKWSDSHLFPWHTILDFYLTPNKAETRHGLCFQWLWECCILIQFIAARYWFSEDSSSSVNKRAASWGISPLEFLKMSGYIKNVFRTQAHRWLYIRETFQLFTTFYFTDSEEPTSAIEPLSQH